MIKRKELKWFVNQMEKKLRENDYKSGWKYENEMYLWERLNEEIAELGNAVGKSNIIDECLDIANFAMMIANNRRNK